MNGAGEGRWVGFWYGLTSAVKILFWLILLGVIVQQVYGPSRLYAKRAQVIKQFEQERKSRVIALIHRQEVVSFFGVPVSSSISIEDSEAVLRAIRLTPEDQPIDVILHTPGGHVLAAEQIGRASCRERVLPTV